MTHLRNQVIRLAHSKPELRAYLLPMLKKAAKWVPATKITFLQEFMSSASNGTTGHHHKGDVLETTVRGVRGGDETTSYSYSLENKSLTIRKVVALTQMGKTTKTVIDYRGVSPEAVSIL